MSRAINKALLLGGHVSHRAKERSIRTLTTSQLMMSQRWSSTPAAASPFILHTNTIGLLSIEISRTKFSTAAMMPQLDQSATSTSTSSSNSDPKQRSKRTRRSLDPLIITPAAAARIHFLISQHNRNNPNSAEGPAIGIRLGTKKRGCNGLSYTLNYSYENHLQKHPRDEAMTIALPSDEMEGHGLNVFVEPMALMNVIGTEMDFVDDEMSSEFTFTNPNSKGQCGCGESFNV